MVAEQKHLIENAKTSRSHAAPSVEKRKEARYPTRDAALVRELPPAHSREELPATVIDVSKSGLRLELGKQLWKGSRIEIAIVPRKLVIFGEVRYCRRSGAIFQVGVLIEGLVFPKPDDGKHLHEERETEVPLDASLHRVKPRRHRSPPALRSSVSRS